MPARNRIKKFIEDGCYHIYNRGVEKRRIFIDEKDYIVFLGILKFYLSPLFVLQHPLKDPTIPFNFRVKKTFFGEIDLLAYCLMPNHFHLLLKQKNKNSITEFMRAIATTYVMYFNKKYDRVGSLFQGPFKASMALHDNYLLYLTKYIHENPKNIKKYEPKTYPYSSYPNYLGRKKTQWVKPEFVLNILSNEQSRQKKLYEDFMIDEQEIALDKNLTLEDS